MTLQEIANLKRAADAASEAMKPYFRGEPAYDPDSEDWIRHDIAKRRAVNVCVVAERAYRAACDEFVSEYMRAGEP